MLLTQLNVSKLEMLEEQNYITSEAYLVKKARIAERTDGRAYDDKQYVSSIEDVKEVTEEQIEEKKSDTPVTEEAPVEAAKETKTEEASHQEDSKAKEEPKEEIAAEKKAEEAETKS
jgi:hypothetical protein